ncbi:putative histone-lysine N-methyltransferase PRDM7, partial [Armadillidium vulgare]
FYVPKTTRLKHALKSWPEFKPPKEDSESEGEETVLSASQSVIKHLWNSVTLEPDSEYKVKIRDYFPSSVTPGQISNEVRILKQKPVSQDSVETEKRRYPKRNCCRKNYNEAKVSLNNDDYFFCDFCDLDYENGCPEHPLLLLLDKESPRDGKNKKRAKATTPWPLYIGDSRIIEAGLGVWTYANLPQGLLFGPYEGRVNSDVKSGSESGYGWKIRNNIQPGKCIDALDPTVSNWMRYVNCSRSYRETNLSAFQFKGEIYYKTIREIK